MQIQLAHAKAANYKNYENITNSFNGSFSRPQVEYINSL